MRRVGLAAGLVCLAAGAVAEVAMIDTDRAHRAAEAALAGALAEAPFAGWRGLTLAEARGVADLAGGPSYWLVPVEAGGRAVGFVRVMGDGTVAALGMTCRTPDAPETCPVPIFAMSAGEIAAHLPPPAEGETLDPPRLVHDGPPGREVWLTGVRRAGVPVRWILTGPGGSYERPAGTPHGADPAIE